ncbi:MAG: CopG family transcriptional regulator [Acidimicrobiales bacterium]
MSKRLQVVVDEADLRRFQRAARRNGLSLAEWARQALRRAEQEVSAGDSAPKLEAVRTAAKYSFPAPGIDQMLAEIEQGYALPGVG